MSPSAKSPLRILEVSRDNLQPLMGALQTYWGSLPSDQVRFPEYGKGGTAVVLLPQHVVKAQQDPWNPYSFRREHHALLGLTREITQRGVTASDLLGADVPQIVAPAHEHDMAMFVMSQLAGEPLWDVPQFAHEDWVIDNLAKFYFEFDRAMANQYPDAHVKNPEITGTAKGEIELPDFAAGMSSQLAYAIEEMKKSSPVWSRYIHNDLNPGNILIKAKEKSIGVIDFGEAYYGDPHFALAKFLAQRVWSYGTENVDSTLRMIGRINELSAPEPWVDIQRCIALTPISIANSVQHLAQEAARTGKPVSQEDRYSSQRAIVEIQKLFEKFNVRVSPEINEAQLTRPKMKDARPGGWER